MTRFFVADARRVGERVTLEGSDAHKLADVLRAVPGDHVEILDGAGRRFGGRVCEIERSCVIVELEHEIAATVQGQTQLAVTLAQGIPKGQKMDFVVEKAVELGVARIVPLVSERTIARPSGAKVERWRRLAKAAATQCGRDRIPAIDEPLTFRGALMLGSRHDAVVMPWELAQRHPLRERLEALARARSVLVLIGPEGGFSQGEADQARVAGALVVSLGPRILRTETAGLALMAALYTLRGEM